MQEIMPNSWRVWLLVALVECEDIACAQKWSASCGKSGEEVRKEGVADVECDEYTCRGNKHDMHVWTQFFKLKLF